MAEDEKVTAKGASGVSYEFYLYPWGTQMKAVGGVYLVLRKAYGNNNLLYIGQTGDLSERFENHHKASYFDRNDKTHIATRAESSEQRRLAIETDLIQNYNPPCNG